MNKKVLIAEDQFVEKTMEKGGVHYSVRRFRHSTLTKRTESLSQIFN
jgi:hypothetical protein